MLAPLNQQIPILISKVPVYEAATDEKFKAVISALDPFKTCPRSLIIFIRVTVEFQG